MNLFENLQILQESNDKELLFSFYWEKGSLNDNIINYLKSKNIRFRYGPYLQLIANINNEWVRFYHENKDGKTYVYIVHPNNMTESSYGMERYSYVGPVYRFNHLYATVKEPIYTVAKSYDAAMRNICFKLKEKYGLIKGANLTIDRNKIKRDTEIEELTKEFEKEPKEVETKIDDPKYNFEDPDRNEEYVVESIMSFDDWLDKNFNNLVKDYAERFDMNEEDVYNEDEDFEEYVIDRYEEYYRNTNRYIDEEDEILEETINENSVKYEIRFEFDIEKSIETSLMDIDILEFNDSAFTNEFSSKEKIKEFEDWYNNGEYNISVININYRNEDGLDAIITVELQDELENENNFAKNIAMYLFDGDYEVYPYIDYINYKINGERCKTNIYKYKDLSIKKI